MRRAVFAALATALATLTLAQSRWSLETASAPYKGTSLTLATVAWPDAIKTISADFTRRTGITVEVVQIPGSTILEKTLLELRNRGAAFDLFTATYKRPYTQGKLALGLRPFFANAALADPDWNRADFVRSAQFLNDPDTTGNAVSIPFGASGMALFYRKDLFNDPKHQAAYRARYRRALDAPRSWQEVEDIAAYFSAADFKSFSGAKGVGLALQGTRNGDPLMWLFSLLASGEAFERSGTALPALVDRTNALTFEPYAQAALERLQRLARSAQPGFAQADDTAARELFLGGGAAMTLTWDSFLGRLSGGDIKGRWALAPMPARTLLGGWSLMLNPNSRKQEAAFLLAQFLSSRESDQRMFELAGRYPSRASTYTSTSYRALNPFGDLLAASKGRGMAQIDSVASAQLNGAIAEGVSLMLAGQLDAKGAAERIRTSLNRALEDAGLR
jgi:ABC-type glycerol-3-phosphate transport system substrate-binding protein